MLDFILPWAWPIHVDGVDLPHRQAELPVDRQVQWIAILPRANPNFCLRIPAGKGAYEHLQASREQWNNLQLQSNCDGAESGPSHNRV